MIQNQKYLQKLVDNKYLNRLRKVFVKILTLIGATCIRPRISV